MNLEKYIGDKKKVDKFKKAVYVFMGLLFIYDVFMPRHHEFFIWDKVPGVNALYGLVACLVVIVFSKGIGKWLLQKKEDFYE